MAKMDYEINNPEVQAVMRKLAEKIGDVMPENYGFTLFIFGLNNQDLFYISNADRESMIRTMQEFIQKYREN